MSKLKNKRTIGVVVEKDEKEKIEKIAEDKGRKVSPHVRRLIQKEIKENEE